MGQRSEGSKEWLLCKTPLKKSKIPRSKKRRNSEDIATGRTGAVGNFQVEGLVVG